MKIALIYPNRYAKYNRKERPIYRTPPLNLLTIAGLTPREHEIHIIDERYSKIDFNHRYDLVAITALTCNAPRAYEIATEFRKRGTKVVLGGMHPSFMTDEALRFSDSVVVGEAEPVWQKVLEDASNNGLKPIYKGQLCDLSTTPMPRWDLLPQRSRYVMFIQATRGCPNACSFCSVSTFFGRKIRVKPVEKVVEEIKKFGKRFVIFVDDNIFANIKYAKQLFKALTPLRIKWGGEASLNTLKNVELIKLAAKSGCRALFIGFETISKKALQEINKAFNLVDYKKIINLLHKFGIAVIASMMFGMDADDKHVFQRTVNFLDRAQVDAAIFSILTPLPGTRLFDKLQRENRITTYDWSKYDALHVVYKPKNMTPKELMDGLNYAYKAFYSPLRVLRRIIRSIKYCPFMIPVNIGYMIGVRRKLTPD